MPSQTFIVRAHARTIHTRPVTFVCAKCHQATTRECYPGTPPKYCLECAPKKKKATATSKPEKGMFKPTHHLVAPSSDQKTPVCLEKSSEPGWFWVRTALDWFSGESIIQYHQQKGLHSRGASLTGYSLETIDADALALDSSTAAINTASARPYTVKEVCKRLKCSDKLLRRMRSSPEFAIWSQSRDPEGLRWEWRRGKFFLCAQELASFSPQEMSASQ